MFFEFVIAIALLVLGFEDYKNKSIPLWAIGIFCLASIFLWAISGIEIANLIYALMISVIIIIINLLDKPFLEIADIVLFLCATLVSLPAGIIATLGILAVLIFGKQGKQIPAVTVYSVIYCLGIIGLVFIST